MLDLARIEAGRLSLAPEPFRPSALVRDVVALHRAAADEKGVALQLALAPEAEGLVVGDPLRLGQVLVNLVSNAVKFTEAGEIRVGAAPEDGAAAAGASRSPTPASGFSQDDRERIFERFEQADGTLTRRFGGTGLGLAISRQLAELMGGAPGGESAPGVGSTFTLTLPLPPAEAGRRRRGAEASAGEPAELPPLRILLADDHPGNRQVISLMLSEAPVELVSVENGREAVDAFAPGRFDTILMDLQMPVMDGVSAIRAIRDLERQRGRGAHADPRGQRQRAARACRGGDGRGRGPLPGQADRRRPPVRSPGRGRAPARAPGGLKHPPPLRGKDNRRAGPAKPGRPAGGLQSRERPFAWTPPNCRLPDPLSRCARLPPDAGSVASPFPRGGRVLSLRLVLVVGPDAAACSASAS